jgi:TPR repeat protein
MTCRSRHALKRCCHCQLTRYCDKAHQLDDWPQHKPFCRWLRTFLDQHPSRPLENSMNHHLPPPPSRGPQHDADDSASAWVRKAKDAAHEALKLEASVEWWARLADNGDAESMFLSAHYLLTRRPGSAPEEKRALALFSKAASHGHAESLYCLGYRLFAMRAQLAQQASKGDEKVARAYDYFRRSADLGCSLGLFSQALCLDGGKGVRRDGKKAVELFERFIRKVEERRGHNIVSERGCFEAGLRGEALARIGLYFFHGKDSFPKDFVRAAEYFRVSARSNSSLGQFMLGTCYVNKNGVDFDLDKAVHLLGLAASNGYENAERVLKEVVDLYGDINYVSDRNNPKNLELKTLS